MIQRDFIKRLKRQEGRKKKEMKKWKQFLSEENKKEILQEFNKKDEKEIMKDGGRFTVSFEIELEVEENKEESRREAALGALGHDPREYFLNDLGGVAPDSIGIEMPIDGEEMLEWYWQYTSGLSLNEWDIVKLALGSDIVIESFIEDTVSILKSPEIFLRDLFRKWERRSELQDLLGWSEKQLTFYFEVEGGKAYPLAIERIAKNNKSVAKIINYYVINIPSLIEEDTDNLFPKSKHPYYLEDFIKKFGTGHTLNYAEDAVDSMDSAVDDLTDRWGDMLIDNILTEISQYGDINWKRKILLKYRDYVDRALEEFIDERIENFESDPVSWLEEMGYEEDQWFPNSEHYSEASQRDCNKEDLKHKLWRELPNFMDKYEDTLKFEKDGSLQCGIEFSHGRDFNKTYDEGNEPKLYMVGLESAIKYLEDFFRDYNNQDVFTFTEGTGLHTNIGYMKEDGSQEEEYNLFKALIFLNHTYATRGVGFPRREHSHWATDLKKPALNNIIKFLEKLPKDSDLRDTLTKKKFMKLYLSRNFEELSDTLTAKVRETARNIGSKSIGFNINYLQNQKYIEFRYPGNMNVTLETMIKALKYYAFIVKAAADPEFKKREYIKDLVGFINNLKDEQVSITNLDFFKKLKKNDIMLTTDQGTSLYSIFVRNMEKSLYISEKDIEEGARYMGNAISSYSYRMVYGAMTKINPQLMTFCREKNIAFYSGYSTSDKEVKIKFLRFKEDSPVFANVVSGFISPRSFQRDINFNNFIIAEDGAAANIYFPSDRGPIFESFKKLALIILESKSSLEVSKKLIKLANEGWHNKVNLGAGYIDEEEFPAAQWLKPGEDSPFNDKELSSAREKIEDKELLTRLVDDIMSLREGFKKFII